MVKDLTFPRNSSIVAIIRGGDSVLVHGDTEFLAGDTVLALSKTGSEAELRQRWVICRWISERCTLVGYLAAMCRAGLKNSSFSGDWRQ